MWIEIRVSPSSVIKLWSLPTRECGLKSPQSCICIYDRTVTPYAGVWIEISVMQAYNINKSASLPTRECGLKSGSCSRKFQLMKVTPYAGVWIEISSTLVKQITNPSLPTRECGLKYKDTCLTAWSVCHSLRGSVD